MIYQSSYDVGGEPVIIKKSGFNKELSDVTPSMDGTGAVGTSDKLARADHVHPSDTTKVDKETGKGLSSNDFTNDLKTKLDGIESQAQKNVQSDWSQTTTTADSYIQNKPEILKVSGYTSADEGKIAKVINDGGAYKLEVTTAGTTSVSWNDVTDKPSTFTPSAHKDSHKSGGSDVVYLDASQINSGVFDIARIPAAAVPTLKVVANQTARFALTKSEVQNGDSVYQTDTQVMYMVKDDTKLNTEDGYQSYTAVISWGGITGTLSNQTDLQTVLNGKVDVVSGKGLSTEDYTTAEKNKLALLEVSEDIPFSATMTKSGKDASGIYTVITWELSSVTSGKPAKWVSTLSGGTSPAYTTRTLVVYNSDKTTVKSTYTYARTYDSDGVLVSEVPSA